MRPGNDHCDASADAALQRFVEHSLGRDDIHLNRIVGGASRASFLVVGDPKQRPVAFLRVDEGRGALSGTSLHLVREAIVMRAMRQQGLPVPLIIAESSSPFAVLMDFLPGEARVDAASAEVVGRAYMGLIARVHAVDPHAVRTNSRS